MAIREVRLYAELMKADEDTNEERLALLEAHREAVLAEVERTARNLELIEWKIGFYKERLGEHEATHASRLGGIRHWSRLHGDVRVLRIGR